MSESTGMSTSEDMARWEALEAEARIRLDGEARESQAQAAVTPPEPSAWDAEIPSWWNEGEAPAPVGDPVDQDLQHPTAADPVAPSRPEILIADADPAVGASIEQAMVTRGWLVRRVTHGEVALAEFVRQPPHCFVFDFSLPGLGGLDLLRKLDEYGIADDTRLVANAEQLPVIFVQRAMAAGVDRFLDRPRRTPDRIVEAVEEQLAEMGLVDPTEAGTAGAVRAPADPAPYTGGLFKDPPPPPAADRPTAPPADPARPDENSSYRSAFGAGGGPPGRIPKLG